jgi:signal transduction histidine kinase
MNVAKILVVDDEEAVREVIQAMLETEGYEVDVAGDAVEALADAKQKQYDLLITDICMPEIDGLELSRRLRESSPDIASILVTGYPTVDTAMAGIKTGVYDYIIKPVRKDKLCHSVASVIKRQQHVRFLEKMARDSQKEENDRGQFVNVLAHELYTSLTPMLTGAELMLERVKGEPNTVEDRLAKVMFGSAQMMRYRLDKLLLLARLEAGGFVLHLTRFDVLTIIKQAKARFDVVASEKGQRLELDIPDSPLPIKADRSCLEQVITNLLENALKFTPEGGKVLLEAKIVEGELLVSVQDSGATFTDEERQRLMQPFWRSEIDRQRIPGVRLGLALCQKLVEIQGGTIWVEGGKEGGNTFAFAVPVSATE